MKKRIWVIGILLALGSLWGQVAEAPASGAGTSGNPYRIATLGNLYWIAENSARWAYHYIQTADIDASETATWFPDGSGGYFGWPPIGNTTVKFTGTLNGDGYSISDLYINRPAMNEVGLIGHLYNSAVSGIVLLNADITGNNAVGAVVAYQYYATVSNCRASGSVAGHNEVGGVAGNIYSSTISDCRSSCGVTGSGEHTGGLLGYNRGTVERCAATGDVTGNGYVGGLIGRFYDGCTVRKSYASGNVRGNYYMGGLVGTLQYAALVEDSHSSGSVSRIAGSGDEKIGGLVGENYESKIKRCYATGPVIFEGSADPVNKGLCGRVVTGGGYEMTANFWDTETSLQSSTAGNASGKTSAEMKTISTFSDASWDIVATYDTEHTWNIESGVNNGYPYLSWQDTHADVPLPISLASFFAIAQHGSVMLSWVTESETENLAFRIYRDGEMIVEREGAGTTSEPQSYSWTDQYVIPGRTYTYVLADVDLQGKETKHPEIKVEVEVKGVDLDYTIGNAYPNPFNPLTVVPLNLAKEAQVHARLYDMLGRPLQELHNGTLAIGSHTLRVDGSMLSTGIYFVHVNVNNAVHVQKIALMK
jgi:hypothetical protein